MYRGSSLVLGCIFAISFGAAASAGALSAVSGLATGVGSAASNAVGTVTGTVAGVAGTAGATVSGATSTVSGAVGEAAGAVGSVAGTAAGAVGTVTGAVSSVAGTAASAVGDAAPSTAAAALSQSDPQKADAQWVSKNLLKLRGFYVKLRAQQAMIVKRDRSGAAGTMVTSTQLVTDACTRFLDQFKVLQSFSRAALFKNCPDIARMNGATTAAQ